MPTKSKLPQNKTPPKLTKPAEQTTTVTSFSNSEPARTASGLNQDAEDQFELELCWCIQQLQSGLSNINLEDKQVYNMTKSLNVLKSHNASLIRKRQVMRNTFGDYRSKMVDDEKKYGKAASVVKFSASNNKKVEKKSLFLKKAGSSTDKCKATPETDSVNDQSTQKAIINPDVSNEPFKFNFLISEQQ